MNQPKAKLKSTALAVVKELKSINEANSELIDKSSKYGALEEMTEAHEYLMQDFESFDDGTLPLVWDDEYIDVIAAESKLSGPIVFVNAFYIFDQIEVTKEVKDKDEAIEIANRLINRYRISSRVEEPVEAIRKIAKSLGFDNPYAKSLS